MAATRTPNLTAVVLHDNNGNPVTPSNPIPTAGSYSTWGAAQKDVAVPGTAEQCDALAAPTGVGIVFKAKDGNSGSVFLGPSQAIAQDHDVAFELAAGQSLILNVTNADAVWVDAENADEGICIAVEQS